MSHIPELPYMTPELGGIGGRIRVRSQDFIVEEIPEIQPNGEGQHLWINLSREGLATREVARKLAAALSIRAQDIGYGGLKDKNSVATQVFSVPVRDPSSTTAGEIVERLLTQVPVTVNWAMFNTRKLRSGHLSGNRFHVAVRQLSDPVDEAFHRANLIAEQLSKKGLPNYYGPQRLGRALENVRDGFHLIRTPVPMFDKWTKRFLISSYLAYLCNTYLSKRMQLGLFGCLVKGDVAKKYATGGIFIVEDLEAEQARFDAREISFTAPIYGPKTLAATGESGRLEQKVLEEGGITMDELSRLKVEGSRRLGRIFTNIDISVGTECLNLSFDLPKGAFATTVLREIMKPQSDNLLV